MRHLPLHITICLQKIKPCHSSREAHSKKQINGSMGHFAILNSHLSAHFHYAACWQLQTVGRIVGERRYEGICGPNFFALVGQNTRIASHQMAGLIGKKSHCHAIDTVAQIGRGWPIGKNVSKMTSALSAVHFNLQITVDWILFSPYRTVNWIGEARPAGVAFVFCLGDK
jgi:hypothetical protein